jgi:hypothetical protein
VKEMHGFRMTFDILFNQDDDLADMFNLTDGDGMQCGSRDAVDTSALLVHRNHKINRNASF